MLCGWQHGLDRVARKYRRFWGATLLCAALAFAALCVFCAPKAFAASSLPDADPGVGIAYFRTNPETGEKCAQPDVLATDVFEQEGGVWSYAVPEAYADLELEVEAELAWPDAGSEAEANMGLELATGVGTATLTVGDAVAAQLGGEGGYVTAELDVAARALVLTGADGCASEVALSGLLAEDALAAGATVSLTIRYEPPATGSDLVLAFNLAGDAPEAEPAAAAKTYTSSFKGIEIETAVSGADAPAGAFSYTLELVLNSDDYLVEFATETLEAGAIEDGGSATIAALGDVTFTTGKDNELYAWKLTQSEAEGWTCDASDDDGHVAGTAYIYANVTTKKVETYVVKGTAARGDYTLSELKNLVKKSSETLYAAKVTDDVATVPYLNTYGSTPDPGTASTSYLAIGLKKQLLGSEIEVAKGTFRIRASAQATLAADGSTITSEAEAAAFGNRIFEENTDFSEHAELYTDYTVEALRAGDGTTETSKSDLGSYCEMHDLNIAVLTESDVGKTYAFTVEELRRESDLKKIPESITLDTHTYTLTIQIYADSAGRVQSRVTVTSSDGTTQLVNDSAASPTTRTLTGLLDGKGSTTTVANVPCAYVTVTNHAYGMKVHKVDANAYVAGSATEKLPLEGAVFAVYADEGGTMGAQVTDIPVATSDENGEAGIWGIVAGNDYWLVETQAPSGYIRPSTAIHFHVNDDGGVQVYLRDGSLQELERDSSNVSHLTVENTGLGGDLPTTGSTGRLALIGAGAACTALGVGLLVLFPKRTVFGRRRSRTKRLIC